MCPASSAVSMRGCLFADFEAVTHPARGRRWALDAIVLSDRDLRHQLSDPDGSASRAARDRSAALASARRLVSPGRACRCLCRSDWPGGDFRLCAVFTAATTMGWSQEDWRIEKKEAFEMTNLPVAVLGDPSRDATCACGSGSSIQGAGGRLAGHAGLAGDHVDPGRLGQAVGRRELGVPAPQRRRRRRLRRPRQSRLHLVGELPAQLRRPELRLDRHPGRGRGVHHRHRPGA